MRKWFINNEGSSLCKLSRIDFFQVLKDWTYERAHSIVAAEVKQNAVLGHHKVVKVSYNCNVAISYCTDIIAKFFCS